MTSSPENYFRSAFFIWSSSILISSKFPHRALISASSVSKILRLRCPRLISILPNKLAIKCIHSLCRPTIIFYPSSAYLVDILNIFAKLSLAILSAACSKLWTISKQNKTQSSPLNRSLRNLWSQSLNMASLLNNHLINSSVKANTMLAHLSTLFLSYLFPHHYAASSFLL